MFLVSSKRIKSIETGRPSPEIRALRNNPITITSGNVMAISCPEI
jgi:hypothetical protein